MSKSKTKNQPKVYSYLRFSTPEQSMGDSERRQVEAAAKWCKENDKVLDKDFDLFDRGVSAYSGKHRKKGKLKLFLEAVENGTVPTGSTLLVENVDRLSRECAETVLREIIFKLWDYGITLQTLTPRESYPPGAASHSKFIGLLIYMNLAHEESEKKSERIKNARNTARKEASEERTILTSRVPDWFNQEIVKQAKKRGEPIPKKAILKEAKKNYS